MNTSFYRKLQETAEAKWTDWQSCPCCEGDGGHKGPPLPDHLAMLEAVRNALTDKDKLAHAPEGDWCAWCESRWPCRDYREAQKLLDIIGRGA